MFAVIFSADIAQMDEEYTVTAKRMRDLAVNEYGCLNIRSLSENDKEITISYWNSLEEIQAWKNNSEHKLAQKVGQTRWYKKYHVEIVEVLREYGNI